MNQAISQAQLDAFSAKFESCGKNGIRMRAVMKNGINLAALDGRENVNNPMIFSVEVTTGKITNQKSSGRCWLFAGLNTLRLEVMRKCNLETFELSQTYAMFWDKLEKANYFLESILETLDAPTEGRLIAHLLSGPVQDGGQWDMFCALVDKYGVVPKDAMPETFHSSSSGQMNGLLTRKLRDDACQLRARHEAGDSIEAIKGEKEAMLYDIYQMLCIFLGEPPKAFDFEYRDKDKAYHREANLTPLTFCQKYVGQVLDDYISVINAPTKDKPYFKTFTVQFLGNVKGGRMVKYLNLPNEEQKALAIAQLQDDVPVWFGCDVGKMLEGERGIMGLNTFDYEGALGVTFGLDKAQRLDYNESLMTHAMVLLGVNLVDGKPTRWKVENSWGDKHGQDGYDVMTDAWFDQYNYQVVVNKKYLTPAQLAAWEQAPIELAPWDPMGSLA